MWLTETKQLKTGFGRIYLFINSNITNAHTRSFVEQHRVEANQPYVRITIGPLLMSYLLLHMINIDIDNMDV